MKWGPQKEYTLLNKNIHYVNSIQVWYHKLIVVYSMAESIIYVVKDETA